MSNKEVEKREDGKFVKGQSGNPAGRPKGSRNKITLVKLMAEQAVREGNYDKMVEVCQTVIEDALEGDFRCRKLVWESMVTKAPSSDQSAGKEKVEIVINASEKPEITEVTEIVQSEED